MDSRPSKQSLLERAMDVEEAARDTPNAQANDLMQALAQLYRERAEELEEDGLFERHVGAPGCALISLTIDPCVSPPERRATLIMT